MNMIRDICMLITVIPVLLKALHLTIKSGPDLCIFCCLFLTLLMVAAVLFFFR